MKIAVLADTHARVSSPWLVELLAGPLAEADQIWHAGDLTGPGVLDLLEMHEALAVAGNSDPPDVWVRLPLTRTLGAAGLVVGLAHGWGAPDEAGLRARSLFGGPLDILVHGHSHRPEITWRDYRGRRELWLNPGSASREKSSRPTAMWLHLDESEAAEPPRAEIWPL